MSESNPSSQQHGDGVGPMGVPITEFNRLPKLIRDRLLSTMEDAQTRAANADRVAIDNAHRLIDVALRAEGASKRVLWLQRAAQAFNDAHIAQSPCRSGCSHCCHIPVQVTRVEALAIGRGIGRRPVLAPDLSAPVDFQGVPCTFLEPGGGCRVYQQRPIACRSYVVLAPDSLLCHLVPGVSIPVPYANSMMITLALAFIAGDDAQVADIRQWFPNHEHLSP